MTVLGLVASDRDEAGHLAVALSMYRAELAERGRVWPPRLGELLDAAAQAANGEWSQVVTVPAGRQDRLRDRDWFSPGEVAAVTGLSLSTVRRRLRDGALRSTKRGRRVLIARRDLVRYLTPDCP